jgi:hypothetical protein
MPIRGPDWVPIDMACLRFSNDRHPRLQDCRLRWRGAAELRRAAWSTKVSGLMFELKASAAAKGEVSDMTLAILDDIRAATVD